MFQKMFKIILDKAQHGEKRIMFSRFPERF